MKKDGQDQETPSPGIVPDVPVAIIAATATACTVQWFEGEVEHRCTLPAYLVNGPTLPLTMLQQGVPYGIPWAQVLKITLTPQAVELALHRAGLWTLADVQARPQVALSALQAAVGLDLGSLLETAAAYSAKKEV